MRPDTQRHAVRKLSAGSRRCNAVNPGRNGQSVMPALFAPTSSADYVFFGDFRPSRANIQWISWWIASSTRNFPFLQRISISPSTSARDNRLPAKGHNDKPHGCPNLHGRAGRPSARTDLVGKTVMSDQLCQACRHFSPAYTCVERPTWGYCIKRARGPETGADPPVEPVFTWADNRCDDFQSRQRVPSD